MQFSLTLGRFLSTCLGALFGGDPVELSEGLASRDPVEDESPSGLVSAGAGGPRVWHPMQLDFTGPVMRETDSNPNPFLDFRLNAILQAPSGKLFVVPGFFDGDGNGGGQGNVWRVRFTPDEPGEWTYSVSFRAGNDVAVSLESGDGTGVAFDGATGSFQVAAKDVQAPGFLAKGFLQYVGEHYLRFQSGEYYLKGGTDSPENLLAYWGFDDVSKDGGFGVVHCFEPHVDSWQAGDPYFESKTDECNTPEGKDNAKGVIGLLNYLADQHVNSVYFLPMNLGGDAWDTSPFVNQSGSHNGNTHYDISRLRQWNIVFEHAMRKGIMLHFVLQETEVPNEQWLDDGLLGDERKLFFRELVARFGHHPAIKWMHGEEWDQLSSSDIADLEARAKYMNDVDPYDHYNAVHNRVPFDDLAARILGNPDFQGTSIQYAAEPHNGQAEHTGAYVEKWRAASVDAGVPWVVDMDENNPPAANSSSVDEVRKKVLYPVYLSGGNLEWYYQKNGSPGPDVFLEDLAELEPLWAQTWFARNLLQQLPFWEMEPADHLLAGESSHLEGGQVFAKSGECYLIYLPRATSTGSLKLSPGDYTLEWFDPRNMTGGFPVQEVTSEGQIALGAAPNNPTEDWVVLVERKQLTLSNAIPGIPGELNGLLLSDAEPFLPHLLYYGFQQGLQPFCSEGAFGVLDPKYADVLVPDADGYAVWGFFYPTDVPAGVSLYLGVVDLLECGSSNVTTVTW